MAKFIELTSPADVRINMDRVIRYETSEVVESPAPNARIVQGTLFIFADGKEYRTMHTIAEIDHMVRYVSF